MSGTRTIRVEYLARVEGEGGLKVRVRAGRVIEAQLKIFEPPRFFEAFLRGRSFLEAPDLTARICGICPVAYQMSAVAAMETACGVEVGEPIRKLRRLLYCGEWIQSHALHVVLLHAPDFLGYPSGIEMARDHGPAVERGLRLKKAGNTLMEALGGRAIHPVNVRVGGFYRVPAKRELLRLVDELRWARDTALETTSWVSGFTFPELERDVCYVALRHPRDYPLESGRVVSSRGLDIPVEEYPRWFEEEQVDHSHALHSKLRGVGSYVVGPLARYNLNRDRLSPLAREAAERAGLGPVCNNPFRSILVRAVETVYACDEALRLIESYEEPPHAFVPVLPRAAVGHGATEAPRGLLYHRYAIAADGTIKEATIVPPTSQNQPSIEEDLRVLVEANLHLETQDLEWRCEQAVRNYDPCISCATHFLDLRIERED
jgi:coenzyme F420-reducing hydrogenase alpha subunit